MRFKAQEQLWQKLFQKEVERRRKIRQKLEEKNRLPPQPPQRRDFVSAPSVESVDYYRLTSFLEIDRSFFSPWNWSPNSPQNQDNARTKHRHRMNFQPGSFFSVDLVFYFR